MKTTPILLALIAAFALSSCSDFRIASQQGSNLPCYSTWHEYPKNS